MTAVAIAPTVRSRRLARARRALSDFAADFACARRHHHGAMFATLFDTSVWLLAILRARTFLRATTGSGFGLGLFLRLFFHVDLWSDELGGGLRLPHPFNIVIGEGARVGRDCILLHGVTLQSGDVVIGDRCVVATNVVVLAGARIGDGAVIGAASVVRGVVPPAMVAVGSPARVVRAVREGEVPS